METVLAERPLILTEQLRALLISDRRCVADTQGICRLSFDPFINAQDYCGPYEAESPVPEHGTIAVPVYAICQGRRDSIPRVIVLLARDSAGWRFADLIYGMGESSLTRLLADSVETG